MDAIVRFIAVMLLIIGVVAVLNRLIKGRGDDGGSISDIDAPWDSDGDGDSAD